MEVVSAHTRGARINGSPQNLRIPVLPGNFWPVQPWEQDRRKPLRSRGLPPPCSLSVFGPRLAAAAEFRRFWGDPKKLGDSHSRRRRYGLAPALPIGLRLPSPLEDREGRMLWERREDQGTFYPNEGWACVDNGWVSAKTCFSGRISP